MVWEPSSVLWESMEHNGGQNFIFYIWDYFLSSLINLKCWLGLPNYSFSNMIIFLFLQLLWHMFLHWAWSQHWKLACGLNCKASSLCQECEAIATYLVLCFLSNSATKIELLVGKVIIMKAVVVVALLDYTWAAQYWSSVHEIHSCWHSACIAVHSY